MLLSGETEEKKVKGIFICSQTCRGGRCDKERVAVLRCEILL